MGTPSVESFRSLWNQHARQETQDMSSLMLITHGNDVPIVVLRVGHQFACGGALASMGQQNRVSTKNNEYFGG